MKPLRRLLDGARYLSPRLLIAAVVTGMVWRVWCLVSTHGEGGPVVLTALSGTCGGCVGTLGSSWKVARLVSNAIVGIFLSLVAYYGVRGVIVRAVACPSNVRVCGVAAMAFLASISKTAPPGRNEMNVIAGIAVALLALTFFVQGIVFLCR